MLQDVACFLFCCWICMHSEPWGGSFKCGQSLLLFREHEILENKKQAPSFTSSGTIPADLQNLKKITKSINIMNETGHFNSVVGPSLWFWSLVAPSPIISSSNITHSLIADFTFLADLELIGCKPTIWNKTWKLTVTRTCFSLSQNNLLPFKTALLIFEGHICVPKCLEYIILARISLLTAVEYEPSHFKNRVSLGHRLNHVSFYLGSRPSPYTE